MDTILLLTKNLEERGLWNRKHLGVKSMLMIAAGARGVGVKLVSGCLYGKPYQTEVDRDLDSRSACM